MEMSEEKSQLESFLRVSLRLLVSFGVGFAASILLAFIFLCWSITFFPIISAQTSITVVTIDLGIFCGGLLAGYLSLSFKRSLITTIALAIILGIGSILIFGTLFAATIIIAIIAGGLLGGWLS